MLQYHRREQLDLNVCHSQDGSAKRINDQVRARRPRHVSQTEVDEDPSAEDAPLLWLWLERSL